MKLSAYHPFRSAKAKEAYLALYDRRAAQWPVASETRMVETFYGQTFVRISGTADAPALVLLPGASVNSLMWMPNIATLSAGYRTYAVDNIYDVGCSIYTCRLKSPGDFMNWLDELFAALALGDQIHLMGLSYGGWLTGQYALCFPNRLAKIVLLAPGGTVLPVRLEFIVRAILSMLHRRFLRSFLYWVLGGGVHIDKATQRLVEETIDDTLLALRCSKPRMMVAPTVLADKELQSLQIPTLYLVGEHERIYSAQKAVQRLKAVAPQIKTEIIPEAGHNLTFVQAELVNRKVLDFLKQPS